MGWNLRLYGRIMDLLRIVKKVDSPISAETMLYATQWPKFSNSPAIERLDLQLRSTDETFHDSIVWLLQQNHIQQIHAPKLAKHPKQ